MYTKVKTAEEVEHMRHAGGICSDVLKMLVDSVKPGMNTKELADMATEMINDLGGKPSFLGYSGFPDVVCISLNDEVVHGIPSAKKTVQDGDIISFDLGVTYKEMIVDSAVSTIVGTRDKTKTKLLDGTKESLSRGLKALKGNCMAGDIGEAVEAVLARNKLGIVRDLVGHGVGHHVHEEPNIPNYGTANTGPKLLAGMTIAVEPMATLGRGDVCMDPDGWTVKTADGSLAAHFEQTVLITPKAFEILTPFK